MALISRWIVSTATRLASDPQVRAKAADLYKQEVKPRAAETWRQARPKLEATRDELADMARETDARRNPGAFAAAVRKRYLDKKPKSG